MVTNYSEEDLSLSGNANGGKLQKPITGTAAVSFKACFAVMAGANGCTISAQTGLTHTPIVPLPAGAVLMFGDERATSITLSAGSGYGFEEK